ncbi:MAG: ABC transporter ATP-binding protein [Aliiglaciecola sp.]
MLRVKDLSYRVAEKVILNKVNMHVEHGEILAVLGPNGAGKTTLLKHMSAQISSQQSVFIDAQAIEGLSQNQLAKKISVVNQFNTNVFALTLHNIVSMGLLPHQNLLSRKTDVHEEQIQASLSQVGLADKQHQTFNVLSGGEQQRGLIARALVQQTPVMILDEPVNHLDVYYQHQILSLIQSLAKRHKLTVVVSLHDLNLASAYCDKVCLLQQGEVYDSGTPTKVFVESSLQTVFRTPCKVTNKSSASYPSVEFFPHHFHDELKLPKEYHEV